MKWKWIWKVLLSSWLCFYMKVWLIHSFTFTFTVCQDGPVSKWVSQVKCPHKAAELHGWFHNVKTATDSHSVNITVTLRSAEAIQCLNLNKNIPVKTRQSQSMTQSSFTVTVFPPVCPHLWDFLAVDFHARDWTFQVSRCFLPLMFDTWCSAAGVHILFLFVGMAEVCVL